MARHLSLIVIVAIALLIVLSFTTSFREKTEQMREVLPAAGVTEQPLGASDRITADKKAGVKIDSMPDAKADVEADWKINVTPDLKSDFPSLPSGILAGDAIAPKLENATIKAELGRSTWKFFHTMMARFPEKPTEDDSLALKTFIQLLARLYPCGDCARHFQKLLAQYPPQVSSRSAAAGWACFVHNQVNERLKKPVFDCTPQNLGDFYDCGCKDDKKDAVDTIGELKLEKEGLIKGG
ncbi:ERV/ALR sulfhydryl oxidase domain-containing protein [Daldinia sp. FL1419]|nr:ERV/ALR sulfhydryl oxidase domain-containing protein [Daldinia sp. FL1419]